MNVSRLYCGGTLFHVSKDYEKDSMPLDIYHAGVLESIRASIYCCKVVKLNNFHSLVHTNLLNFY